MKYDYMPDRWTILQLPDPRTGNPDSVFYKVLGGWAGGYLDTDHWRVNSGIVDVLKYNFGPKQHLAYIVIGESGSSYFCHAVSYGTTLASYGILERLKDRGVIPLNEEEAINLLENWPNNGDK